MPTHQYTFGHLVSRPACSGVLPWFSGRSWWRARGLYRGPAAAIRPLGMTVLGVAFDALDLALTSSDAELPASCVRSGMLSGSLRNP